jgi:hypothetical protein
MLEAPDGGHIFVHGRTMSLRDLASMPISPKVRYPTSYLDDRHRVLQRSGKRAARPRLSPIRRQPTRPGQCTPTKDNALKIVVLGGPSSTLPRRMVRDSPIRRGYKSHSSAACQVCRSPLRQKLMQRKMPPRWLMVSIN